MSGAGGRPIDTWGMTMNLSRLLATSALALGMTVPATATAAPADPFTGPWRATDVLDGSDLKLNFSGSGATRTARLRDDDATFCATGGKAVGTGSGTVSGNVLTLDTFHLVCKDGTEGTFEDFVYEFDPSARQIIEVSAGLGQRYDRP